MKTIIQALTFASIVMCIEVAISDAQVLPKNVLDAAKSKFEQAYQAEYGKPPSAATTAKAMQTYTAAVNSLAANLGTQAGQKAKRMDNMRVGVDKLDGPALIDVLDDMRFDTLGDLGFSKKRVVELTELDTLVNQLDGKLLVNDPQSILKLKEKTEIVFPAGDYTLDERRLVRHLEGAGKKFPKCVTFVGSGKEKTTLKLTDAGFTRSDVDRLSFRDMTIDCNNDGLFDKRQGSLTLRLANVRLVRFDAGHGGCKLFRINDGLIVHATDSEFIGGHGSSPGNGNIFSNSDVFLGYFERCTFSGINNELFRPIRERTSILWMNECKFDKLHRSTKAVQLTGCKFDFNPPELDWVPQDAVQR